MGSDTIKPKISNLPPPIYTEAKRRWGVNFYKGVVFTYGDTIHIANPKMLSADLEVHEREHISQQMTYPGGPEAWWKKYFDDKNFRINEELAAYRVQYQYVLKNFKTRFHEPKLNFYAVSLGTIYGLEISREEAKKLIENG